MAVSSNHSFVCTDPANEPDFYKISEKYPVEETAPVTIGVSNGAKPQAINIVSGTTSPTNSVTQVPQPNAAASLTQLLSVIQGAPKSQPVAVIQPLPPLEQLVALVSSATTSAPTPPPPSANPVVTGLLQVLLGAMGGATVPATSPAEAKLPSPTNNDMALNDIMSMLIQMTNVPRKDNNILVNVVNALIQKQREQQEAAKLAVMLAMCLNPSTANN